MIYTNTAELIEYLKRNNLWMKKSLGQNFLVDMQSLAKIIAAADLKPTDKVLEIGPGAGVLTNALLKQATQVTSIELDNRLIPILTEQFADKPNFQLIHLDALQFPLPEYNYKLVANIPYYITSPIINHFLSPQTPKQKRPQIMVLLTQKEVAEKACAGKGKHSILSLQIQIYGKAEITSKIPRTAFFPQPNVDSAILKITPAITPLVSDIPLFFKLIKAAFSQRRKNLLNSLCNGLSITKEQTEKLLAAANISPTARPQELDIPDWENLIQTYKNF